MILRRYGSRMHSVRPNFDSLAITEITFRRDHEFAIAADEFGSEYERREVHRLAAEADGNVQRAAEDALLSELERRLTGIEQQLADGMVLVIENETGVDMPKPRQQLTTRVVGTENRYHFHYTIEPPLEVGVYVSRNRP